MLLGLVAFGPLETKKSHIDFICMNSALTPCLRASVPLVFSITMCERALSHIEQNNEAFPGYHTSSMFAVDVFFVFALGFAVQTSHGGLAACVR